MTELEIPSYFLCPISFQIMQDPVTLLTGITYDRSSIERWIFTGKHDSCPVTNQKQSDRVLTPNHTLRRLIQAWCVAHAADGVERFPTPRPPIDLAGVNRIINEAKSPEQQLSSLRKLKSVALESERNRSFVGSSDAVDFLASVICSGQSSSDAVDEAVSILNSLQISKQGLSDLVSINGEFVDSLTKGLRSPNLTSRTNAMFLLKSVISVIAPSRLIGMKEELFVDIVRVLTDQISTHATKSALKTLVNLCPWGQNRVKAVRAGAVHALVELLIDDAQERRIPELVLSILYKLCRCAEGRAKIVAHAAGIAAVSMKILRVSPAGNEFAVKILQSLSKYSATAEVLQEMVQVEVVDKLCMMLYVDCGPKVKGRAIEILRMHSRVWASSPCLNTPLLQAFVSSLIH